ncbi:MAG: DEAD/DEAH box helicase, partial [Pontibacterium sp.]
MLDKKLRSSIQTAYSTFLNNRGLKPRASQKEMIAHVARTLGAITSDHEGQRSGAAQVCVVEAGTGTGKTLAYLLSTIPIAQSRGKKVVVSTATVALQEQLIEKDLPQLISHSGLAFTYSLAKGRGRYFCTARAEQHLESQQELGQIALYEDEVAHKLPQDQIDLYKELLNEFASGRWDGDKDSLSMELAEEAWQPITSDHIRCTNRRCDHFSSCPFFQSRQKLDVVDLVVANHDLVLADLSLGGGAILPAPEDAIYIFDEGHHLADKTRSHFAYNLRLKAGRRWIGQTGKALNKLVDETGNHQVIADIATKSERLLNDLGATLDDWLMTMDAQYAHRVEDGERRFRFASGVVEESIRTHAKAYAQASDQLTNKFEQALGILKEAMDGELADIEKDIAERWYPAVGMLVSRSQAGCWLARSFSEPDKEGLSPTARWISVVESAEGDDYEYRSCPVSAASTLQEHLWDVCYGTLVTSATLTALGHFGRLSEDLGLPGDTAYARLPSPFDYPNNAVLEVPAMRTDPKNPQAHTEEVRDYLVDWVPKAQAGLVLFSS